VVHAARNGFFYTLDRINGSFIAGKQYVAVLAGSRQPQNRRPRTQEHVDGVHMSSVCSRVPCRLIAAGGSLLASPARGGGDGRRVAQVQAKFRDW
jgi:hypothetical protein